MRASELTEAIIDDYVARGFDRERARPYADLGIPASYGRYAIEDRIDPQRALRDYHRDLESSRKRQEEEDRTNRLIGSLDQLAKSNQPLSHDEASAVIAHDDEMFWDLMTWLNGDPDFYEDHPEAAMKLRQILQRIKPFDHPPLYRGEAKLRLHEDTRGFHSWTPNEEAVRIYYRSAGGSGHAVILKMTKPARAVEHANIGNWRMRLKPDESHYLGSRAEWFVLDGQPAETVEG